MPNGRELSKVDERTKCDRQLLLEREVPAARSAGGRRALFARGHSGGASSRQPHERLLDPSVTARHNL